MSTQLLVNVVSATVPGGSVNYAVPHGLRSNDKAVAPTLILPASQSVVVVSSADAENVYLSNPSGAPVTVTLRCERGLSNELDAETITPFFQSVGTGEVPPAPVQSVGVAAPIVNTGTASNPVIGASVGSTAGTVCAGNDARLSNERVPVDGSVTTLKVATANKDGTAATPSMRTLGTGAQQACAGNDSRLSYSQLFSAVFPSTSGSFTTQNVDVSLISDSFSFTGVSGKLLFVSFQPRSIVLQNASANNYTVEFSVIATTGGLGSFSPIIVPAGGSFIVPFSTSISPQVAGLNTFTSLRLRMSVQGGAAPLLSYAVGNFGSFTVLG